MEQYEGSNAISNARTAVIILAVMFLIAGFILMITGFIGETEYYMIAHHEILWSLVIYGTGCVMSAIFCFILNAILKGFEHLVLASEVFMREVEKDKEVVDERKKRTDAKIEYLCKQ